MRKLGIVIAITAAATLGFAGHASAQSQEQFCNDVVGGVTGGLVENGVPIDDTAKGAVDSCLQSGTETGLVLNPLLCGVEKDVSEVIAPELGGAVGSVHGGLDDIEDQAEAAGLPNIVTFDHPCDAGGGGGNPTTKPKADDNGGGGAPAVQAANAAPDGGLPRTGGELFAGAGFALMSLGALVRRFLP